MEEKWLDEQRAAVLRQLTGILPTGFLLRKLYGLSEAESKAVLDELDTETLGREASILAIRLSKMRKEYAEETGIETTKVI